MNITRTLLSLALAIAVAACSRPDDPQALIASAKDYVGKRDYKAAIIQLKNALRQEPDNAQARYLLGLAALESGDIVSAEVELDKAAELGLGTDELHLARARTLLAKGEAAKLVAGFSDKSLSTATAQAELRALVGTAQLRRGDREEANAEFREALSLDAKNVLANLGIARLVALERDFESALRRVEAALANSPQSFDALLLKADLLAALQKNDSATQAYRAAIEVAPHQVDARIKLVGHLLRLRSLDLAAAEVEALQKAAPRDVRTRYMKALVLAEQRKFAQAKDSILQVLKVMPEHVPSLTLAGMAAYETGAYAEAEGHLRKALFNVPGAVLPKRLLAATHLRMGQSDSALQEVKELLQAVGEEPSILALAGEAYLAAGDVASAARHYEKARTLTPDNVRVQTRLAQIRFAAGDPNRGFAELEAASASNAEEYQADLALIAAHLRWRNADKALEAIQTLEKKQPKNPLTHSLRGMALLLKHDSAGARASFERALELNPTYMPAVTYLARMDLRDKKPQDARRRYEAVVKKEPKNEQALLGLSALLRITGADAAEIERLLKQSIAANPGSARARAALVNHHLRARDTEAALAAAQEGAAANPNSAPMLQLLGVAQLAAGEHRQATASFTRLAKMLPDSPQPHLQLARARLAAKQPDEAIKSLRAALELQPDLASAQRDIAAIYVATGRAEQAVQEARQAQKDRPDHAFGYVLEGEIHIAKKNWADAERVYRAAAKKFDQAVLVARAHAVIAASGKEKEADNFAQQWVETHPKDAFVLNYLAERDLKAKRYETAAKRYRAALERAPDNAMLLNNLAWAAYQLHQPDALQHAERAHELAPDNPAIMDTLGGILVAKGETDEGLELLARAAELSPQAYHIRLNFAKALLKADRKKAARKELEALAKLEDNSPVKQEAVKLLSEL